MMKGAAGGRDGAPAAADPHRIKLYWLLKIHWGAIVGQVAVVLALPRWLGIPLPSGPLLAVVAAQGVAMVVADVWTRRRPHVPESAVAAVMLFDAAAITAMLLLAGGYANPFSILYVVNVALAAVMLRPAWSWALLGASLLLYGSLFLFGNGGHELVLPNMSHDELLALHLRGLWVALAIAAGFIVYIVQRVTRELEIRDAELAAERSLRARRDKISSLATLAAGAAHELSTPLAVIAVVTKELQRALDGSAEAQEDLKLIKDQLARCQLILQAMAADAGENAGEPLLPISLASWAESALDGLPQQRARVVLRPELDIEAHHIEGPARALARALRGLIKNALQASPADANVEVRFRRVADELLIEVVDRGSGMPPDVLARVGEPFFTTKMPGQGMGLGLFLTRALAEQLGGALEIESTPGKGTIARLRLPAAPAYKTGVAA
jgi:two-component system sensor histidine kinase RegB